MSKITFSSIAVNVSSQVILPLLKNDFYEVIQAIIKGKLRSLMPVWSENSTAVSVVMISKGYPGDYANGMEITGDFFYFIFLSIAVTRGIVSLNLAILLKSHIAVGPVHVWRWSRGIRSFSP